MAIFFFHFLWGRKKLHKQNHPPKIPGQSRETFVCVFFFTIGAKIITHTTFTVGELVLQVHTHQLHNFNCRGINLCNACVSLVSVCLASIISQIDNYNNNCWGIYCVIIPAPMVCVLFSPSKEEAF